MTNLNESVWEDIVSRAHLIMQVKDAEIDLLDDLNEIETELLDTGIAFGITATFEVLIELGVLAREKK